MYAVFVRFWIKADRLADFMPLAIENAQTSLQTEQGCRRYDICTDPSREGEVLLYELYFNRAAFDGHLKSSHFNDFDTATAPMIAEKTVETFAEVKT